MTDTDKRVESSDYSALMGMGHVHLAIGDFKTARSWYKKAYDMVDQTVDDAEDEGPKALQMLGITFRLMGDNDEAIRLLNQALSETHYAKSGLRARIDRDLGMSYLAEACELKRSYSLVKQKQANVSFAMAEQILSRSASYFSTQPGISALAEYGASMGFKGRIFLEKGDKKEAFILMSVADDKLRVANNRNYELNNLIWLLRLMSRANRKAARSHVLQLIEDTGQTRRLKELRVIMLGGNGLYSLVEGIHRSFQKAKRWARR